MKLKTLKDIYGNKANGQISVKELKAEAVKWVKMLKEHNGEIFAFASFKDFFNITEEDLK